MAVDVMFTYDFANISRYVKRMLM